MAKFKVKDSFSVVTGEYPFHQQLKNELVPVLKNYTDQQNKATNVKATMTGWNFNTNPESMQIKKLKLYLTNALSSEYQYNLIGHSKTKQSATLQNFWGNVYRKGEYTQPHNHWPTFDFSFVYFLKSKWYNSPLVFDESGIRIFPKEGTYVLFHSLIKHHVPKHRFKDPRITLSGNWSIASIELGNGYSYYY